MGYQSTYALSGSELQRGYGVRGAAPVTITVARHVASPNGVSFSIGGGMLTATITATAGSDDGEQRDPGGLKVMIVVRPGGHGQGKASKGMRSPRLRGQAVG